MLANDTGQIVMHVVRRSEAGVFGALGIVADHGRREGGARSDIWVSWVELAGEARKARVEQQTSLCEEEDLCYP